MLIKSFVTVSNKELRFAMMMEVLICESGTLTSRLGIKENVGSEFSFGSFFIKFIKLKVEETYLINIVVLPYLLSSDDVGLSNGLPIHYTMIFKSISFM